MRRILGEKKIYEAHCSYAFQNVAHKYDSHLLVTISVVLINTNWLIPLAYFSEKKQCMVFSASYILYSFDFTSY